jgi:hypothetical protein
LKADIARQTTQAGDDIEGFRDLPASRNRRRSQIVAAVALGKD